MPSILQDWVTELPIRHQGVLLAAVRGCDSAPKECSAKPITRAIRGAFLRPADVRELEFEHPFMSGSLNADDLKNFLKDWDHYPIHFVQHLMHACQVLGYRHPNLVTRDAFYTAYYLMVDKLHLLPEKQTNMDERLTEDRIAKLKKDNTNDLSDL